MSLKDLPSPSAPNFLPRVREMLHTLAGKTGSTRDRALTLADAIESGVIGVGPGGSLVPGPNAGETYVPDLTPPPAPDTLTATPAISHILLEVPAATYTQGHGHLRTRVYGVTRLSGDPAPVFADAVEVGQFSGTVWAFPSNPSTTWHFWAKWESVDGVLSATPVGGTNGVVATTGQDVSSLLDALAGQIGTSQLANDLATPIGKIPALESGLAQEILDRAQAVADEASDRAAALAQEASNRAAAIQAAADAAASNLSTEIGNRVAAIQQVDNDLRAALATADAAVVSSLTSAFQSADAATLASAQSYTFSKTEINNAISAMGTQLTTNFTAADAATLASVQNFTYSRSAIDAADAATLSTLRSEFAAADSATLATAQNYTYSKATIDSAIASSASTLRSQLTGGSTATDLSALTSGLLYQMRETSAAQDAALAQDVTDLQTDLSTLAGDVATKASASALSALETRVTSAEGVNTSQGSAITSLQNSLTTTNNTVATKADASALSALTTRVTSAEGTITSHGTRLNTLESTVNNPTTGVAATAAALDVVETLVNDGATGVTATANKTALLESKLSNTRDIFAETWDGPDPLSRWQSYDGAGEQYIVSVADGVGGKALRVGNNAGDDMRWLVHRDLIPFDPNKLYRMRVKVRRTNGSGVVYVGWAGVASDGTTLVSLGGENFHYAAHYHAAASASPGAVWTEYVGYTKGHGAPYGDGGVGSLASPGKMHQSVRYLRALVLVNYSGAAGITEVGPLVVDDAEVKEVEAGLNTAIATKADASALSALSTTVTNQGNTITAQGNSITTLQGQLATVQNDVATKADASALSSLSSTVTSQGTTITSQGTAITGLQNSVSTINGTLANKADVSALNTLSTTVSNQGNTLTAQGTSITALQSQVIGGSNQVKNSEHPDGYSPLVAGATKSLLTGQTLPDGSTGSVVRIVTTAALTVRIYRCIKQNGKHSAQMWCRATAGAAPVILDICDKSPTKTFTPSASWSFQALEGVNVDNYSFDIYHFLDIALPAGITFDIWHLQVELGDKATGWGPSGDDLYSAVQVEATTRASETGNLFAKYTVKVDVAGHVGGYGFASKGNAADPVTLTPGLYDVDSSRILSVQRNSTATYIDGSGALQTAPANTARYQGGQLLVEGEATNYAVLSSNFADTWATDGLSTLTPGAGAGPAGGVTATKWTRGSNLYLYRQPASEGIPSDCDAVSLFVKADGWSDLRLSLYGPIPTTLAVSDFDLAAGTAAGVIGPAGGIEPLANGWFRISLRTGNGETPRLVELFMLGAVPGGAGFLLDGFQVEQDAATSHIPTTTAPATRAADIITVKNDAVTSEFGIRADQFFVAPPATSSATAPTIGLYKGMVWVDTSVTPNVTRYYTGSSWSTTPQALPFVVQTTPTTINGETVPPGVYFENAYMARLVATRGQIGLLAVDDARIASMSVSKLTTGSIAVGQYAQSTGYVAGSSGWRINGDGTAEFSGVVVRGTIFASQGAIGGWTIGSNYLQSTTYALGTSGTRFNSDGTGQIGGITIYSEGLGAGSTAYDTGAGAWIGRDGRLSLRNSAGTQYLKWDGSSLQISGALQAATGTFAGSLSAATGTFSGSLTADAVNAVSTINLAGQAVTIPISANTASATAVGTGEVTVQTATIVSSGAPITISAFVALKNTDSSQGARSVRLFRGGTVISEYTVLIAQNVTVPCAILIADSPGAGTHTYTLRVGIGAVSVTASNRTILLLETKR